MVFSWGKAAAAAVSAAGCRYAAGATGARVGACVRVWPIIRRGKLLQRSCSQLFRSRLSSSAYTRHVYMIYIHVTHPNQPSSTPTPRERHRQSPGRTDNIPLYTRRVSGTSRRIPRNHTIIIFYAVFYLFRRPNVRHEAFRCRWTYHHISVSNTPAGTL